MSMVEQIKIIELDHFYRSVRDPLARFYFGEMALLRAEGYGPEFPKNYLPLDVSDFVCWHYLFCLEEKGKQIPIGGFKHMSLKRCDQYVLTPPFLTSVKSSKSLAHIEAFEGLLEKHRQNDQDLVYGGGFTVKKDYRADRPLAEFLKELLVALVLFDKKSRSIETIITGGNLRFKTDRLFLKMGYQPLKHKAVELGPFTKNTAFGDQVLLLQLEQPTAWAESCYEKHRNLIESRQIIADRNGIDKDSEIRQPNKKIAA